MIEIDLNARILLEDHNVFVVRPRSGDCGAPNRAAVLRALLSRCWNGGGHGVLFWERPSEKECAPCESTSIENSLMEM
jgi:hypothetical protein